MSRWVRLYNARNRDGGSEGQGPRAGHGERWNPAGCYKCATAAVRDPESPREDARLRSVTQD